MESKLNQESLVTREIEIPNSQAVRSLAQRMIYLIKEFGFIDGCPELLERAKQLVVVANEIEKGEPLKRKLTIS